MQGSKQRRTFFVIISLIVLSAVYRLFPHPYNFAPITGMALLSGAYLKRFGYLAYVIPLLALFVSDVILNNTLYRAFYAADGFILFRPYMIATYASLLLIVLVGGFMKKISFFTILSAALFSSVLFFVLTNFSSWLEILVYPKTFAGLIECFMAGLPFFHLTLIGDIVFSLALFGIAAVLLKSTILKTQPSLR